MHIPDGFLSVPIWAAAWAVSGAAIALSLYRVKGRLKERTIPLMGVLAAFIFAAQMLNVPIALGTSGHLIGAVLAAVLLGPYSAIIVMVAVLFVQAILFQDGGMTALGANIFNMGLIGAMLGYSLYAVAHRYLKGKAASAAIAAWLAVVLASAAAAMELHLSGTAELMIVLPAMAGVHAVIGLVEAGVTASVLVYLAKARPDLLKLHRI